MCSNGIQSIAVLLLMYECLKLKAACIKLQIYLIAAALTVFQ